MFFLNGSMWVRECCKPPAGWNGKHLINTLPALGLVKRPKDLMGTTRAPWMAKDREKRSGTHHHRGFMGTCEGYR